MLDEFLGWWLARWRELLPDRWTSAAGRRAPVLLLRPDRLDAPAELAVRLRIGGSETPLGRLPLEPGAERRLAVLLGNRTRPAATVIDLPPGTVLAREVALPLAAEPDLARVLGYEMDRLTPFAVADLFTAHTVRKRDRAAGRLLLTLAVVPRATVAPVLDAVRAAGLRPAALEGADRGANRQRIPLAVGRAGGTGAIAVRAAWAIAAGLLVLLAVSPFARQSAALHHADAVARTLARPVREADRLRDHVLASAAGADVLAEAGAHIADPLAVLATLTAALPDDTYLTDLSMNGRKLTLNGQSASAAKLIGLLAADPLINNPAFAAPVTRLEATHTDLFSIRADVTPLVSGRAVAP